MGSALDRFSALLVGWVPDLSRLPARRQVAVGGVLAILLHLLLLPLILLVLFLGEMVFPKHEEAPPLPAPTLEVEIMAPKPATALVPAFEEHTPMIDPSGLQASVDKPKNPLFQSEQDMQAGAQNGPKGDLPLPSQEGERDRPVPAFADQAVVIAAAEAPIAAPPAPAVEAPAAPPPLYTPQPVDKAALTAAEHAPPETKLPEPAKPARATPPPQQVAMLQPNQVAFPREPEPAPLPPEAKPEVATPVPRSAKSPGKSWMPQMDTPRPQPQLSRTQEESRRTAVAGAIINRGLPGVDAQATPLGRWWMVTKRAIYVNWKQFLDERADLVSAGRVRVSFTIDEKGEVHGLKIDAGSGNSTLDEVCLNAIRKTAIPAPPPDVMEPYPNRQMDQDVTFNLY